MSKIFDFSDARSLETRINGLKLPFLQESTPDIQRLLKEKINNTMSPQEIADAVVAVRDAALVGGLVEAKKAIFYWYMPTIVRAILPQGAFWGDVLEIWMLLPK